MIIKKILSLAASIISLFILHFIFLVNSISQENNIKSYSRDSGVLSLMYHRFNENKYPSTNIKMDMFDEQMKIIKNQGYENIGGTYPSLSLKISVAVSISFMNSFSVISIKYSCVCEWCPI